jgi:hypothetical protein
MPPSNGRGHLLGDASALLSEWEFLDSFFREREPFDCFILAGWYPKENDLSDTIAALFESGWKHGFGVAKELAGAIDHRRLPVRAFGG